MPPTRAIAFFALTLAMTTLSPPAYAQGGYPPVYPIYPTYRYAEPDSNLRVAVKPKDAAVYVDGYFAGRVEEFDGTFQRLHVVPGQHEIVVYLEGYRSLRQRLYLSPNVTRKIEGTLEKLSPGEALEQPPVPPPDADGSEPREPYRMPPVRVPVPRPGEPAPEPGDRRPPPDEPEHRPEPRQSSTSGALSIRVHPSGATVIIDGQRWTGPSDDERLIVQVPEGRHRIEAQREGYRVFVTEIDVRAGQTAPVNISLSRQE